MKSNFNLLPASSFKLMLSKSLLVLIAIIYSTPLFSQTIPSDPASVTATPSVVCAGNSCVLKAVSPGNTIRWYTVSTGGSSIGSSTSGGGFLVYPSTINVYYAESLSPSNIPSNGRLAITITINIAPVITSSQPDITETNAPGQCGKIVIFPDVTVTGSPTPAVTYSNPSGSTFDIGTTTNIVLASNTCGSTSLSFDVSVVDNEAPAVITPPSVSVTAPTGFNSVTGVSLGTPTVVENCGSVTISNNAPATFYGGNTTVTWTVTDSHGNSVSAPQTVTVVISNTPPSISSITTSSSGSIMATGSSTTFTINWIDEAGGGPYTVEFDWNDGTAHDLFSGLTGNSKSASHIYNSSGVYEPIIKVTDGAGAMATSSYEYLAVYVTGDQFTTAGGNFTAPAGSLVSNPSLSNKVTFGNNCKPKNNGGFDGSMEMNFQAGNFKFKSANPTNWDYLAVSNCYLAIFQGSGTVNGSGNYGILIAQTDKDRNPANANNIRIKIWNKNAGNAVVFDTQPGADNNALPVTPVTNGSIKVHVQNNCIKLEDQDVEVFYNGTFETSVYPNPFTSNFNINVSTVSDSPIKVEIYDMVGKLIQSISDVDANEAFTIQNNFATGMYFVRILQDGNSQTIKLIKNNQ